MAVPLVGPGSVTRELDREALAAAVEDVGSPGHTLNRQEAADVIAYLRDLDG